jgi:hypothetical protein
MKLKQILTSSLRAQLNIIITKIIPKRQRFQPKDIWGYFPVHAYILPTAVGEGARVNVKIGGRKVCRGSLRALLAHIIVLSHLHTFVRYWKASTLHSNYVIFFL